MPLLLSQLTKGKILLCFVRELNYIVIVAAGGVRVNGGNFHSSVKYTISTIVILGT